MNGEEIPKEITVGNTTDQCLPVLCISPRGTHSRVQISTQTGERAHIACTMAREDRTACPGPHHKRDTPPLPGSCCLTTLQVLHWEPALGQAVVQKEPRWARGAATWLVPSSDSPLCTSIAAMTGG